MALKVSNTQHFSVFDTCNICNKPGYSSRNRFVRLDPPHPCTNLFHEKCVEPIVWNKTRPQCPLCEIRVTHVNGVQIPYAESLLVQATDQNKLDEVKEALKIGVASDSFADALSCAVEKGFKEIVGALMQDCPLLDLGPYISKAARKGHRDIMNVLLTNASMLESDAQRAKHQLKMFEAIQQGDKTAVDGHLNERKMTEEERGEWVVMATSKGHVNIVRALLRDGPISQSALSSSVHMAMSTLGNVEMTNLFVNSSGSATLRVDHQAYVRQAESIQNNEMRKFLGPVSKEVRGSWVKEEAARGNLDYITIFLQNGEILESDLFGAINNAAEQGYVNIIEFLLSKSALIPQENRMEAMKWAASGGHTACVKVFLGLGPISEPEREEAMNGAVARVKHPEDENIAVVETLLANGTISMPSRIEMIKLAAFHGYTAIVKALLANEAISEPDLWEAIKIAASKGYSKVVKVLLPKVSISETDRLEATKRAASSGDTDCARILLALGDLSESERDQIIHSALQVIKLPKDQNIGVVQALLEKGTISKTCRAQTTILAALRGYTAILEALVANGAIAEPDLYEAIKKAGAEGYTDIVRLLLAKVSVPKADRLQAIQRAAEGGHMSCMKILLKGVTISELERGEILKSAVRSDLPAEEQKIAVVATLLTNGPILAQSLQDAIQSATEKNQEDLVNLLSGKGLL